MMNTVHSMVGLAQRVDVGEVALLVLSARLTTVPSPSPLPPRVRLTSHNLTTYTTTLLDLALPTFSPLRLLNDNMSRRQRQNSRARVDERTRLRLRVLLKDAEARSLDSLTSRVIYVLIAKNVHTFANGPNATRDLLGNMIASDTRRYILIFDPSLAKDVGRRLRGWMP